MNELRKEYHVLGLMSGTSLDGVDLALCTFSKNDQKWQYKLLKTETFPYSVAMLHRLKSAHELNALDFSILDNDLGRYFGELIKPFISGFKVDLIASHGHTIFHQPEKHFTKQIGNGAAIYATTGIATACDFRSVDVNLGGQGAPLVPLGDKELFSDYDYRINLGGIANTSFEENGITKAYDICPFNQVFNYFAQQQGFEYDDEGKMARGGLLNKQLFSTLNGLAYYHTDAPKSLGREWVETNVLSEASRYNSQDFMRTFAEHVALQIANTITKEKAKVLLTGGGAYNHFFLERLRLLKNDAAFYTSDTQLISFKEALIFAFLGLKGGLGEPTSLASVTGAKTDSLSMALYGRFIS